MSDLLRAAGLPGAAMVAQLLAETRIADARAALRHSRRTALYTAGIIVWVEALAWLLGVWHFGSGTQP